MELKRPVTVLLNTLMADPLMTIFGHCYFLYLCHLLEFNSHLTGEHRSTEITNDTSSSTYDCACQLQDDLSSIYATTRPKYEIA